MANLYYNERLSPDEFEVGATIDVVGDEARHAVRVARLRLREHTLVGDGRALIGAGEVVSIERDRFSLRLERVESVTAPKLQLVLVQALAKGDRDERAVEQATEFGVDEIVPWQAVRSVSRWDGSGGAEKSAKGVVKWARIAREAAKQSLRARIPVVREPTSLAALCETTRSPRTEVIVLHPRGERPLSDWRLESLALHDEVREIYVVVGPEGGLSDDEIDALEGAGAKVQSLGKHVLRTSSAGPAALAVLNIALGRW